MMRIGVEKRDFDIRDLNREEGFRIFEVQEEEAGLRLDRFLGTRLHWMSRTVVQRLIEGKAVSSTTARLGGMRLKCATKVDTGDRIEVAVPKDPKDQEAARRSPPMAGVDTLYEDEHILVIDKPAGVPVHPVGMNLHRTILTALHARYRKPGRPEEDVAPMLVHRLDVETSGVLLVAKDRASLRHLAAQFRERRVTKEYAALVYGLVESEEGEIRIPLGLEAGARVPYKQTVLWDGGREAVTRFKVLRRGSGLTLLELTLLTGRKHQLRVHLRAIGHPVVGDKIYGPDEKYYFKARHAPPDREDLKDLLLDRQALHAFRLTIEHPVQGKRMCFDAPIPAAFESLLEGTG
jgi:23S rRNA pseudouridine1911/1915/1917 synthase